MKTKKLTARRREFMRCRLLAYDLISILEDAENGRFDYALSLMLLEGTRPVGLFSDEDLQVEWKEGGYAGVDKARYVQDSRPYQVHAFIRQLWDKGSMTGMFSDKGFSPVGSPDYKASAFAGKRG